MRIPGSKVYRAFPELDRFTDEQCRRFTAAAQRAGWIRKAVRLVALVAVFLAANVLFGVASGFAAAGISSTRLVDSTSATWMALTAVGVVTPVLLAILTALLVRDLFLRRRIRAVINDRGRCAGCGYSLLGLTVAADLTVTCPECGATTPVDLSIAELQQGAAGAEFRPTVRVAAPVRTPQLRRRRRRIVLSVVAVIGAVILTPIVYLGWNELTIRLDATRARALRPGGPGLAAVMQTLPAPPEGAPRAWDQLEKARMVITSIEAAAQAAPDWPKNESGNPLIPDYSNIGETLNYADLDVRAREAANAAAGARMLPLLKAGGAFDALRAIRQSADLSPPFTVIPGQPLVGVLLPELAQARSIGRVNKGRAMSAIAADDPDEFIDAMLNIHALARMCEQEPFIIARLVSIALDAMGDGVSKRALMTRGGKRWADAVERATVNRTPRVPMTFSLNGERVITVDSVCFFFQNPSVVRQRQVEVLNERMEKGRVVRVGRLTESLDEVNAAYDAAVAAAAMEAFQRPALPGEDSGLWAVRTLLPGVFKSLRSYDQVEGDRRGLTVMIALERFKAATGAYPESLTQLTPALLPAIPTETWTGRPVCYRRIDPATDPVKRGYLLYYCGQDHTDDGGKPGEFYLDAVSRPTLTGIDYIINDEAHFK